MFELMHLMNKEIIGLLKMVDEIVLQLDHRQILFNIYLLLMIFQINMMVNLMLEYIPIKIKKKWFIVTFPNILHPYGSLNNQLLFNPQFKSDYTAKITGIKNLTTSFYFEQVNDNKYINRSTSNLLNLLFAINDKQFNKLRDFDVRFHSFNETRNQWIIEQVGNNLQTIKSATNTDQYLFVVQNEPNGIEFPIRTHPSNNIIYFVFYFIIIQTQKMDKNFRDQYIIEETEKKLISMGQFGQIYECQRKDGNQKEPICVKIIKKTKQTMNQSLNEIKILQKIMKLKSENLLHIENIFEFNHQFEIIMERCNMDLEQEFNILQKNKLWYTDEDCFNILTQITNGIRILYYNNILHRDIKPSNILVKVENTGENRGRRVYKISDFGFSKILENYCQPDYQTSMGTPLYASPQVFNNLPFSGKCDIYSIGILFYQIFFNGNMPIIMKKNSDLQYFYQILLEKQFKCQLPNYSYAEQIADLLQQMIVYREEERISFDQFFKHPLLNIQKEILFSDSIFNQTSKKLYIAQKEHISNLLDRVYQIQVLFYRKYLFYKSVSKKLSIHQQIYKKAALYCLSFLGIKQLLYYMSFIHIIISDIHPYFQKEDFHTLVQHLILCNNNLNLHPQYQQQISKIKKEYFNEKKNMDYLNNQLQQDLKLIQGNPQLLSSFIEIFQSSKYKRIEQNQIINVLKFLLDQKLLDGFEVSIQAAISLDEQFPINNFKFINPDDIFKD